MISDEELLKLWKDPNFEGSFRGLKTFQSVLKRNLNIDVSTKRLHNILSAEPIFLIHQKRPKVVRRHYYLHNYGELVQMDLAQMFPLNGFKYFLLVVDCYSSKLFVTSLKNKDADTVSHALTKIFKKFGGQIYKLESDRGTEFVSSQVKQLYKRFKIYYKSKFGKNKASFAERYIYIVKRKLYMLLRSQLSENWVKYLPIVVDGLNKTPIKKLGYLMPNSIGSESDSVVVDFRKKSNNLPKLPTFSIQETNKNIYQRNKSHLQPGDFCYKFYDEKLFDKKYNISVRNDKTYCDLY